MCLHNEAIIAAYLFGSAVKGNMKPTSDVDVALLIREAQINNFPVLTFMAELEKACRKNVDVVLLNRAEELLQHEVRRTGRLIFDRDPSQRKHFEIRGRKRYEDFLYLHRRYTRKVLYEQHDG